MTKKQSGRFFGTRCTCDFLFQFQLICFSVSVSVLDFSYLLAATCSTYRATT